LLLEVVGSSSATRVVYIFVVKVLFSSEIASAVVLRTRLESHLVLLVAVLPLLGFHGDLQHFWVEGVFGLAELFVSVGEVTLVAQSAISVGFVVPAPFGLVFFVEFVGCHGRFFHGWHLLLALRGRHKSPHHLHLVVGLHLLAPHVEVAHVLALPTHHVVL